MKVYLYVDDERSIPIEAPKADVTYIARSYKSALRILRHHANSDEIYIDLDHDLGSRKTGSDLARYIVEAGISNLRYNVHSMNPVGKANIESLLSHYGYSTFSFHPHQE